jgi:hypothetical protein
MYMQMVASKKSIVKGNALLLHSKQAMTGGTKWNVLLLLLLLLSVLFIGLIAVVKPFDM